MHLSKFWLEMFAYAWIYRNAIPKKLWSWKSLKTDLDSPWKVLKFDHEKGVQTLYWLIDVIDVGPNICILSEQRDPYFLF